MNRNTLGTDGEAAASAAPITLPDLCHHAEYRIYVNGQYVESAGSLGRNAQHVLEFWKRRRRGPAVEARPIGCTVTNCAVHKTCTKAAENSAETTRSEQR